MFTAVDDQGDYYLQVPLQKINYVTALAVEKK